MRYSVGFATVSIVAAAAVSLRNWRAGFPATMVWAGTFIMTTDPATTMLLSPMVTPFMMMEPRPIQTPSSIRTGWIS